MRFQESELHIHDAKDHRAPAKKNRISAQLDVTQEEEEQNGEAAPTSADDQGMSSSPPTESKIRQISQGVEDISWKNQPKPATPGPEDQHPEPGTEQHAPMDAEESTTVDAEEPVVPPLMRGENPPLVIDNAGEDEHAGEADPAEVPPDAQPDEVAPSAAQHEQATPPPDSIMHSPKKDGISLSRQGSDENLDSEKTLKRKLGDRTVSERKVPEDHVDLKPAATAAAKRPRDDDTDENPRETKRPTPPPDEELQAGPSSTSRSQTPPNSSTQTQTAAFSGTSTPKFVSCCFMWFVYGLLTEDCHVILGWIHVVRIHEFPLRFCEGS